MTEPRKLRVFLCHASQDKPVVRELYQRLLAEGWIDPWLDEEKLLPGQDWDLAIEKAVETSDAVLVFVSLNSVSKEGYIQKELRFALDVALEKPEEVIYIIPLRLDESLVPRRLSRWQWVDLYRDRGYEWLIRGLELRAKEKDIITFHSDTAHTESKKLVIENKRDQFQSDTKNKPSYQFGGIELKRIPTGPFMMGSKLTNDLAKPDERPQHSVNINYDYWMARFPITNSQFADYVEWTKNDFTWSYKWKSKLDHPVVNIKMKDASRYCFWLTERYKNELPDGLVFRVPTEAEWEKAARGALSYEWPWGNEFDKAKANCRENLSRDTSPVGMYSPVGDSPFGISDMAGNVWEWTLSRWEEYPYNNDVNIESQSFLGNYGNYVLRGGSYRDKGSFIRTTTRTTFSAIESAFLRDSFVAWINTPISLFFYDTIGFRIVLSKNVVE